MRISDWSSDVCSSDLTHREVSTLFWINAGLGMVAALLMVPLAPLLAWFYGEPELSSITLVLGIGFALRGLDRKSVVEGKSVSVRVDLGGRRIIKKKNKKYKNT